MRTEDSEPLTRVAARGLAWSWATIVANTALQLVYTAVMARLLEPSDFGLMAAAMIGLRFVSYLARFGLGSAVVQRATLAEGDVAVAFLLALSLGIVTAALAVVLSPLLAAVAGQPEATDVIRWLGLGLLINALTTVPEALLRRRMQFKLLSICQVASFAFGYVGIGIPLAVRGWGVWSLVGAVLGQSTLMMLSTAIAVRLPLRFRFDRKVARELMTFGGAVTVTGFLEFLGSNVDTLSVSRWIGATGLGQYSRATYLVGLPVEQATAATSRVLLPTFSRVQNEPKRFVRGFTMSVGLMALVVMLPVAAAAAAAPTLVRVMLGSGWDAAASVLPIVGAAYGVSLLTNLPAVAAESKGAVGRKLLIQVYTLIAFVGLAGVVVATGPTLSRFACAWLASELFRHVLYWVMILPVLGVRRLEVARRYSSAALLALVFATPIVVVVRVMAMSGMLALLGACVFGAIGVVVVAILPTGRVLREDVDGFRKNLKSGSGASDQV